ncbi:MAG TPA: hypothetical protein VFI31_12095, partial [Pirellulales bacterium]|nr:hypothetical protein [Pirellulales bacterium]
FCGLAKWDSAIRAYHFAKDRGFWSAGLSNNMALALTRSGQREEAIEWLERALAADRSLGAAYYQRARVLAALANDSRRPMPVQAVADIERAAELYPENGYVCLAVASIFGSAQMHGSPSEYGDRSVSFLLKSLRLGISPEEIRSSGIPLQIIERAKALSDYQLAIEQGATAERRPPPGLVDSLAGVSFE